MRKRLPILIAHDEASVVEFFNSPGGGKRRGEGMVSKEGHHTSLVA